MIDYEEKVFVYSKGAISERGVDNFSILYVCIHTVSHPYYEEKALS